MLEASLGYQEVRKYASIYVVGYPAPYGPQRVNNTKNCSFLTKLQYVGYFYEKVVGTQLLSSAYCRLPFAVDWCLTHHI